MNAMKNKVQLIGNLGMTPEIHTAENGRKMARMSLATNEYYKNTKGERVQETTWHNIVAWGNTADVVERLLHKGSEVMIEGKLVSRHYTDKQGAKRHITEVVVADLLILEKK